MAIVSTTSSPSPNIQDQVDAGAANRQNEPAIDDDKALLAKRQAEKQAQEKKTQSQAEKKVADNKANEKGILAIQGKDTVTTDGAAVLESSATLAAYKAGEEGAPTDDGAWRQTFEGLLDRCPKPLVKAGAQYGTEDLREHALPVMLVASSAMTAAASGAMDDLDGRVRTSSSVDVQNRIATFKSYSRIVDRFWTKAEAKTSEQLLAEMPAAAQAQLRVTSAQVAEAYRAYLKAPAAKPLSSEANWTAGVGEHVPEIPDAAVAKMEQAVQGMGAHLAPIEGSAAASGEEGPDLAKVYPLPARFRTLGGAHGGPNLGMVDIDSLLIIVMMQATQVEESLLRDQLMQMQQVNEQKKTLRDIKTRMKQESARIEGEMLTEFNEAKSRGEIAGSIKFEDYKAWRECQWADVRENVNADGTRDLSWPPMQLAPRPPIPEWMHTGNVEAKGDAGDSAVDLGKKYGLPPQVQVILQKIYNHLPQDEKDAYGNFEDYMMSLGLVPANSIEDIRNNLQAVKDAIEGARSDSEQRVQEAKDAAKIKHQKDVEAYNKAHPIKVDMSWVDGTKPELQQQLKQALEQYAVYQVLAKAGFPQAQAAMDGIMFPPGSTNKLADLLTAQPAPNTAYAPPGFKEKFEELRNQAIADVKAGVSEVVNTVVGFKEHGPTSNSNMQMSWYGENYKASDYPLPTDGGNWGGVHNEDGDVHFSSGSWGPDGFHGVGHEHVNHGWPDSDSDFDINYSATSDLSFVKMLQDGMRQCGDGTHSGLDADACGKLNDWMTNPPVLDMNLQVADPDSDPSLAMPSDEDLAKGEIGGGSWDNAEDKIDDLLNDLDDPNSPIRRFAHATHTDGSPVDDPEKARDDAVAAAAAKAQKPSDGMGGVLENTGNLSSFNAYIEEIDNRLSTLSEASELDMLKMQSTMERRGKFIEALSNMIKKVGQITENVVNNLK